MLTGHATNGAIVETRRRRTTLKFSSPRQAAEAIFKPKPASDTAASAATPAKAKASIGAGGETDHEKVFRLVSERQFEDAARIAARLINGGGIEGFFVLGGTPLFRQAEFFHAGLVGRVDEDAMLADITPEIAQVLLSNNDRNRRVDARNLSNIMRDIVDGRWQANGESLIVADDGRVNDGQHRFIAVLLTGHPIRTILSFGVSAESMRTVNTGKKRQSKDRLAIAGIGDYVRLSSISTLAFETYEGRSPTPAETEEYFYANQSLLERASSAAGGNMKGVGPSAAGVAAMHLMRMGFMDADIRAFFAKVRSGEMLAKNDPQMSLHRAIFVDKYKIKLSRDNWVRAFVNHFIALQDGRKPVEVQFQKDLPKVA